MTKWLRTACVIAMTFVALALMSPAASAVAPTNDDQANATVISSIPFTDSVDTTEATNEPSEDRSCGVGATVWYAYTATESGLLEASYSGFDIVLAVFESTDAGLVRIGCSEERGPGAPVTFEATAGTTYYFQLGGCCGGETSDTGTITFILAQGTAPTVIDSVTIDDATVAQRTGTVMVLGTVTCSGPSGFAAVTAFVSQERGSASAGGFSELIVIEDCTGATPYAVELDAVVGIFRPGRATIDVLAENQSDSASAEAVVPILPER